MSNLLISIVSHGQLELIKDLLDDLSVLKFSEFKNVNFVLTLNIEEDESLISNCNIPLHVIRNLKPLGFGANHNQAFKSFESDYFLILNPDIRLYEEISLITLNSVEKGWGCFGPLVYSSGNHFEDSARKFPSTLKILKRVLFNRRESDYPHAEESSSLVEVDWVGGMFLLFKSQIYSKIEGFDERFFMYLEDADICRRINKLGYKVYLNPNLRVIHDARRSSLKSWTHFKWHLRSMIRFLYGF